MCTLKDITKIMYGDRNCIICKKPLSDCINDDFWVDMCGPCKRTHCIRCKQKIGEKETVDVIEGGYLVHALCRQEYAWEKKEKALNSSDLAQHHRKIFGKWVEHVHYITKEYFKEIHPRANTWLTKILEEAYSQGIKDGIVRTTSAVGKSINEQMKLEDIDSSVGWVYPASDEEF